MQQTPEPLCRRQQVPTEVAQAQPKYISALAVAALSEDGHTGSLAYYGVSVASKVQLAPNVEAVVVVPKLASTFWPAVNVLPAVKATVPTVLEATK
jgi:hypothetical protein